MTIGQIATKVAWFFNRSRSDFVDTLGGDLLIDAINMTRLDAEREHDFVLQEGQAAASLDPANGCDLSQATSMLGDTISTTTVDIKTLIAAYIQDPYFASNQIWYPVLVSPKKLLSEKAKEYLYRYGGIPSPIAGWDTPLVRYPGDIYAYNRMRVYKAYWQGRRLFLDPRPQTTVQMAFDANLWMTSYNPNVTTSVTTSSTASSSVTLTATFTVPVGATLLGQTVLTSAGTAVTLAGHANATIIVATVVPYSVYPNFVNNEDYTDWMTQKGADYLIYGAICQINYRTKSFIPRAEGFIGAPEKYRDSAFATMVQWDAYMMETSFTPRFLLG